LAFRIALARPPDADERAAALDSLAHLNAEWAREPGDGETNPTPRALTTVCHAVLNSASFLYID
jgi:hypothetical protein